MNFNRLNGSARPQSLYINSPNNRLSSQDLVSKERHRNVFTPNQVHPASHSTTPGVVCVHLSTNSLNALTSLVVSDSGAVIPLSSSPHLIPLFRDLVTYAFHVHNSADSAEYFVNNWLKNIRPQICEFIAVFVRTTATFRLAISANSLRRYPIEAGSNAERGH